MMPEIEHLRGWQPSDDNALFDKYEVGKLLGCGAFAKVYHARDIRTGQSVAIKVINKKKISGAVMAGNIKREISVMRRLHNPYIVKLFEVLATKTKIYFVMEFVKGGELFAKVAKGRFSEDLARKYFRQLVSALGYCHSRGIFHRDLKPENLLLDENGDLKVSDFGLSAVSDQVRQDGLLHTQCGTPAYVAPEILTKKGYDGAKADVWSCGVVLYVLTAGYLPFNDPNLMVMYKKIYKGEFRCPRWMSPDLKRLLSRLLDTNPAKRITIDEITEDPWFRKGSKSKMKFYDEFLDVNKEEDAVLSDSSSCLNAFDLISFSTGLNLSGLFDSGASSSAAESERIVVESPPEDVMARVEGFAAAEKIRLRKRREWGVDMEGQNGKFTATVIVHRLTETLVVVEGRRAAGDAEMFREAWKEKIGPAIVGRRENEVSGGC